MIRSLFASALLALAVHAAPAVLPNGAVMTPNDEVLRRQPVATDVSSLYARPSGGIPDSDLSAGVRGSLGRADTALQEHQSLEPVTNYVDSATNAIPRVGGAARPLPKYLHALDFDDSYPEAAQEYYSQPHDCGGCSAVRDGGFLCRNFDFPFDERAEFVVRMSAGKDRFASIGVAQVGTNLTEDVVTSGRPSRCYKWLPGATVDGINENGVVVEINAVDTEVDPSQWSGDGDIHPLAAVRWALDRGKSAGDAATNLAARVSFPMGWTQNFHWMLADERETWIVENGVASNVTEVAAKRVMTNFPILPDDCEGEGLERYRLLLGGESITNAWWTPAYLPETSPVRYSDLGTNYMSVWERWADKPREAHRGESIGGQAWWQTVHTSVYDITNRVLRIAVQETDDWYVFALKAGGCGADEPDPLKVLAAKGRTAFKVWAYDADIANASTAEAKELFASVYGPWIRDAYPGSENVIKAARMLASRRERFVIRTRVPTNDCDVVVSWGDGSTTSVRDFPWSYGRGGDCVVDDKGNTLLLVSHDYVSNGVFTVEILGTDYIGFRHQAGSDFDLSGRMSDAECSLVVQCLDLETPVSRHIVNLSSAFAGCRKILRVKSDYAYPLVNVRNCATLFYACPNLKTVEGLSAYGDASGMFKYCYALQHTSVFVTRDVTNAATMYDGCTALADDVSKLVPGPMHRSAAVNVSRMFRNCPHVTANPMPAGFLWEDSEVMWSGTADAFSGCSDDVRSLVPVSWGGSNAAISVPGYVAPGGFVHDVVTDDGVSVVEDGVARVVGTGAVERTVVAATNALGQAKADRATTLAGYGITDGATKAEMESGLSSTNDYLRTSGGQINGNILVNGTAELAVQANVEKLYVAYELRVGDNTSVSVGGDRSLGEYGITDARALANNVCAADSFGRWDVKVRDGWMLIEGPYKTGDSWEIWVMREDGSLSEYPTAPYNENDTYLNFGQETATRFHIAVSNESYVTQSFVTNAVNAARFTPLASDPAFSNAVLAVQINTNLVATIGELNEWIGDYGGMGATSLGGLLAALLAAVAWLKKKTVHLESDGTADDDFAADLLGKQVAKEAMHYALGTASSATMEDRTVNILTMTQSETLTFPTATSHDNKTYARDFLLKLTYTTGTMELPQGVTKVGDELSFEAGKTYLIAFTEIAADKFYVRAIDITEEQA